MSGKQRILSGVIVRGAGEAAYFTKLDWVQKQCAEKLGFKPFPGTLNILVNRNCFPYLEDLQKKPAIELLSPNPSFCNARLLPASLNDLLVAIIIPDEEVNIHDKNIVEVIAPVSLKKTLSLRDGEEVVLFVENTQPDLPRE
ncbi:DUF120 domain-containing protein [Desulfobacterium sp. N47]|uniref:Riboflavin kinase n=1 Tax=uncultured Desulfobacterium sp. TaxID=201089 RepID=E1YIX5_9BACT|nr:hypothetical protein N47_K27590 [uncultured Desulfobacterium sp.]